MAKSMGIIVKLQSELVGRVVLKLGVAGRLVGEGCKYGLSGDLVRTGRCTGTYTVLVLRFATCRGRASGSSFRPGLIGVLFSTSKTI